MEFPAAAIRVYKTGDIRIERDLVITEIAKLDLDASLASSATGYILAILPHDDYQEVLIISKYKPALLAYLEGFVMGRNVDYVSYEDVSNFDRFKQIYIKSYENLLVDE